MQKKYKEQIKLVIDAIINQEKPTLEDRKRVPIDKRLLRNKGLENKEIDNILEFLEDKGCLNFFSRMAYFSEVDLLEDDKVDKDGKKIFSIPFKDRYDFIKENYVVVIPDFEKLEEYKKQLTELSKNLLYKDDEGYFYYNNQLIKMDKQNVYYKILDILYTFSDITGFMSYEQIDSFLVRMNEEKKETPELRCKRIKNAISGTQGLFRFAKINNVSLENKSTAGKELIEIIAGKGLKLNNSKI